MKKNILISVYDMEIGGIERSLINMLESFDYDRYEVDLLIFHHTGDFLGLIPDQVNVLPQIDKLSVFRTSIMECLRKRHFFIALIRLISKFIANKKAKARKLKEGSGYIQMQLVLKYFCCFMMKWPKKYDIAISYAWPHDLIAKKVDADKKIAWIHTDYKELEIDNEVDLNVWNKFDYIASISEACTESFLNTYPILRNKIILIENITSPHFIKQMANETIPLNKKNKNVFNIVSVGRLSYAKGFDLAIHALRKLHDRGFTDIKWHVVGYGGYESTLLDLIEKNELSESFFLVGKQANPYPFISACDIYVQPSRYEGKAVTVTEAKILGKPILLTNYPTARSQIIDGLEGIICDLSVDGLANGIERLYKSDEFRTSLINNIKNKDYSNYDELGKLYQII